MTAISITHEGLEALGFAKGHIGKLLAPNRSKNVGPKTFGPLLQLLGIKLIAIEDKEGTKNMRPHWVKRRKAAPMLSMERMRPAVWLFTPRSAHRALKIRNVKLTADERSNIASHASRARWERRAER
ncbi:MAG TPA: hypothetical protein VIJ35_19240 [Bradyrhizobium sp.]